MTIEDQVIARLKEPLAAVGFTQVVRVTRQGRLLSVKFVNPDPDLQMTSRPNVEVYVKDMYPNERGEAFGHVWSWIGMDVKSPRLAAHLTKMGVPTRATTFQKNQGIRFKFEPNYRDM